MFSYDRFGDAHSTHCELFSRCSEEDGDSGFACVMTVRKGVARPHIKITSER
jgi:hypothetical protein